MSNSQFDQRPVGGPPQQFSQQVPATNHVAAQHQQQVPPMPSQPWRGEDQAAVAANVQMRQARDKAVYSRQQKGHSLILHLLFGGFVLWIPAIYFTASPNHYWHA